MGDRGWVCPICGKALAPWVRECDHYYHYDQYSPYVKRWIQCPYCGQFHEEGAPCPDDTFTISDSITIGGTL